jgi:hypothetical protein
MDSYQSEKENIYFRILSILLANRFTLQVNIVFRKGPVMSRESEFRARAEECERLAQTARTPQQRVMLMHIAETWLRLADDAAKLQGADTALRN